MAHYPWTVLFVCMKNASSKGRGRGEAGCNGNISLQKVQFAMETLGHHIESGKLEEIFTEVDLDGG